jgi:hypothetical protein
MSLTIQMELEQIRMKNLRECILNAKPKPEPKLIDGERFKTLTGQTVIVRRRSR